MESVCTWEIFWWMYMRNPLLQLVPIEVLYKYTWKNPKNTKITQAFCWSLFLLAKNWAPFHENLSSLILVLCCPYIFRWCLALFLMKGAPLNNINSQQNQRNNSEWRNKYWLSIIATNAELQNLKHTIGTPKWTHKLLDRVANYHPELS